MMYDVQMKKAVLDSLLDKMSSTAYSIIALSDEGFVPNKMKFTKIGWANILFEAYKNIDMFTNEQQDKLDNLFNQFSML